MIRSFTSDDSRHKHDESSTTTSPNEIVNTNNNVLRLQVSNLKSEASRSAIAHHTLAYENSDSIQGQSDVFTHASTFYVPSKASHNHFGHYTSLPRDQEVLPHCMRHENPHMITYRTASLMKQPVSNDTAKGTSSLFSGTNNDTSLFSKGNDNTNKRNAMQLLLSPRALPIVSLQHHQKQVQREKQHQILMKHQHKRLNDHHNQVRALMLYKNRILGVAAKCDVREQHLKAQIDRIHHPVAMNLTNHILPHGTCLTDVYQELLYPYQNLYNNPLASNQYQANEYSSVQQAYYTNRNKMKFCFSTPRLERSILSVPASLPIRLIRPVEDRFTLSAQQYLLREQIEIFEASEEDIMTHTRGRNKPITVGQVGIRCVHCAHVPVSKRQKGSTYYPSNKLGIYQAAQNMSSTHIQCGLCDFIPDAIKQEIVNVMMNRHNNTNVGNVNGAGRPYWANMATQLGLVDTESGIRFIRTLLLQQPNGMIRIVDNDYM